MNTATQANIPVLGQASGDVAMLATFGAFKVDERFSFVRPYDPKVTSIAGYRHAVVRYRVTENKASNVVSKPAQMVTVPQIKLPEEYTLIPEKAQRVLMGVFEDEQDMMIRSLIDSGASRIGWDLITLDCILDSLTAVRISSRLTKEQIEQWAKVALREVCTTRAQQIAQEKRYDAKQTELQVIGTLNAYSERAMKLAAPVPNLGQNEATALKNLLIISKLDDDMSKVLLAKLEQILNPKVIECGDL